MSPISEEQQSKEELEEAKIQAKRKQKHPPTLHWWMLCTVVLYGLAVGTYTVCHTFFPAYNTGKLTVSDNLIDDSLQIVNFTGSS